MSAHSTNALADLIRSSAAEQAAALAAGEVSSRELTQAHLDRIAAVERTIAPYGRGRSGRRRAGGDETMTTSAAHARDEAVNG